MGFREKAFIGSIAATGVGAVAEAHAWSRAPKIESEIQEWTRDTYVSIFHEEPSPETLSQITKDVLKNGFYVPTYELPKYDDAGEPVLDENGEQMYDTHTFNAGDYDLPENLTSALHFNNLEQLGGLGLLLAGAVGLYLTRKRS